MLSGATRRLEMVKDADGKLHWAQCSPSSQLRSDDQRDATSASFPWAAFVASFAACGTPMPCGLPAIHESNVVACLPS